MSRIQLALNVSDLEAAVAFYSQLFAAVPHKQRPGYANFAIDEPPLKLVLIESDEPSAPRLNHLGVEVGSAAAVAETTGRLDAAGVTTDVRTAELCCHAVQDKVWTTDPDDARWEIYTIVDDDPLEPGGGEQPTAAACCAA